MRLSKISRPSIFRLSKMDFGRSSNWTERSPQTTFPFQHYSLRHRAIAWISQRLFDRFTYTVRHGLIRGMKRKGGLGWMPAWLRVGTQTKEEMFWRDLPLDGLVVYDVGAFHGILTLFFASRGRAGDRLRAERDESRPADRKHTPEQADERSGSQVRRWRQARSGTLLYDPAMAGGGSAEPKCGRDRFRSPLKSRRSMRTSPPLRCPRPI